jgi:hypothetical protein
MDGTPNGWMVMCFATCAESMHVFEIKNVREGRLLHLLTFDGT